jgi:hypothetical protein
LQKEPAAPRCQGNEFAFNSAALGLSASHWRILSILQAEPRVPQDARMAEESIGRFKTPPRVDWIAAGIR